MLQSSALHRRSCHACLEEAVFGNGSMVWLGSGDGWTLQGMAPVVRLQCRFDKRVRRTLGRRGTTKGLSEVPSLAKEFKLICCRLFLEWNNDREAARGISDRKCFPTKYPTTDTVTCQYHFHSSEDGAASRTLRVVVHRRA